MPARYHYVYGSAARAAARAPRSGPALPGAGPRRAGRVRWARLGGVARPDALGRTRARPLARRGTRGSRHSDGKRQGWTDGTGTGGDIRRAVRARRSPPRSRCDRDGGAAGALRLAHRSPAPPRRALPRHRTSRGRSGRDDPAARAQGERARRTRRHAGARARRLLALADRPSGRRLALGAGWVAEVAFDRLRVYRGSPGAARPVVASRPKGSAVFGGFRVEWAPGPAPARLPRSDWTTWIAGSSWEVRALRPGDRLVPVGGVGHRPVRRLLMEARVPRSSRASYPVVARGETILWVPGICRSAADLPRPGTRAVRLHVTECSEPQTDGRA